MNQTYRLKKNRDFQRIYRRGKSVTSPYMTMLWTKAPHDELKIGFSVSKKVGNAVTRNRVRRRIREAIRVRIPEIKKGHRLIIVARPSVVGVPFSEITETVDSLLQQANLKKRDDQE